MPDDVRVVFRDAALAELGRDERLRLLLRAGADPVVAEARARAPHRTGLGAASIHSEMVLNDGVWEARIGWTRDRYYLRFHELGSVHLPARPFLVPALDRYRT